MASSRVEFDFDLLDSNQDEWALHYFQISDEMEGEGEAEGDGETEREGEGDEDEDVVHCLSREGLLFVVETLEQTLFITKDLLIRGNSLSVSAYDYEAVGDSECVFQVGPWHLRTTKVSDRLRFLNLIQRKVNRHITRENVEIVRTIATAMMETKRDFFVSLNAEPKAAVATMSPNRAHRVNYPQHITDMLIASFDPLGSIATRIPTISNNIHLVMSFYQHFRQIHNCKHLSSTTINAMRDCVDHFILWLHCIRLHLKKQDPVYIQAFINIIDSFNYSLTEGLNVMVDINRRIETHDTVSRVSQILLQCKHAKILGKVMQGFQHSAKKMDEIPNNDFHGMQHCCAAMNGALLNFFECVEEMRLSVNHWTYFSQVQTFGINYQPEVHQWINELINPWMSSVKQHCLLVGDRGVGKTSFAAALSRRLSHANKGVIHVFFNSNSTFPTTHGRRMIADAVRSLAVQISFYISPDSVDRLIRKVNELDRDDASASDWMKDLVLPSIRDLNEPMLFIVDGIDSLDVSHASLFLSTLFSVPPMLKILLTTRSKSMYDSSSSSTTLMWDSMVRLVMDAHGSHKTEFSDGIAALIKKESKDLFKELTQQSRDDYVESLVQNSECNLVYVQFTCNRIRTIIADSVDSDKGPTVDIMIAELSRGLFNEYDRIFNGCVSDSISEMELIEFLAILVFSCEPMSSADLAIVLPEYTNEKRIHISNVLTPFICCANNGTFNLYHDSVKDWLHGSGRLTALLHMQTLTRLQNGLENHFKTCFGGSHYWRYFASYLIDLANLELVAGRENSVDEATFWVSKLVDHMFSLSYLQEKIVSCGEVGPLIEDCRRTKLLLRRLSCPINKMDVMTVIEAVSILQRLCQHLYVVEEKMANSQERWWHAEACTQILGRVMFVKSVSSLPLAIQSLISSSRQWLEKEGGIKMKTMSLNQSTVHNLQLWKHGITGDVTKAIVNHKRGFIAVFTIESRGVSSAPDMITYDLRSGARKDKRKVPVALISSGAHVLAKCLQSTGEVVVWEGQTIRLIDLEEQVENRSLVFLDALSMVCECESINLAVGFKNGRIGIYKINVSVKKQKKPILFGGHLSEVTSLVYDSQRRRVCSGDIHGNVMIWTYELATIEETNSPSPSAATLLHSFQLKGSVASIALLDVGDLVTLNDSGNIQWWPTGGFSMASTLGNSGASSPRPQSPMPFISTPVLTFRPRASFNLLRRTLPKDQLFSIHGDYVITKDQSGLVVLKDGKTITKFRGDYNFAILCQQDVDDESLVLMIENPKHEGTMSRAKSILASSGTSFIELRNLEFVTPSPSTLTPVSNASLPTEEISVGVLSEKQLVKKRVFHTTAIHGLTQRMNSQLITMSDTEVILWDLQQNGIHKMVRTTTSQIVFGSGREPLICVGGRGGRDIEYVDLFGSAETGLCNDGASDLARHRFPCHPTRLIRCVTYLTHRHFAIAYQRQSTASEWVVQICDLYSSRVVIMKMEREVTALHCSYQHLLIVVMGEITDIFDVEAWTLDSLSRVSSPEPDSPRRSSVTSPPSPEPDVEETATLINPRPILCLECQGRVDFILEVKPGWLLFASQDSGVEAWNLEKSANGLVTATREWCNLMKTSHLYVLYGNRVLSNSSPLTLLHILTGETLEFINSFTRLLELCEPFTPYAHLKLVDNPPFISDERLHSLFILDREKRTFATISGKELHVCEVLPRGQEFTNGEPLLFEKILNRKEIH